MTLRNVRYLGYRIPDLAWLMLRELEYFFDQDERTSTAGDSDSAFTL